MERSRGGEGGIKIRINHSTLPNLRSLVTEDRVAVEKGRIKIAETSRCPVPPACLCGGGEGLPVDRVVIMQSCLPSGPKLHHFLETQE
jgi:hypothetical protein